MKIEIFDPEMCCTTGVCGPAPDPALIRMQETVERLKAEGVEVARYQLSRNPMVFAENTLVYGKLLGEGTSALPMVLVDGELRFCGRYPAYEELLDPQHITR